MPYRLDLTTDPAAALRAAAVEQLQDAIDQLRSGEDPVTAVHEARKDLKKVRSLLRLARTDFKPKRRRAVNGELREIAAGLAGARDADVMVATVAALGERFTGQLPARTFTTVRQRFAKLAAGTEYDDGVIAALEAQRDTVADWPLGEPDLAEGAAIAYARGRDERRAARKDPSVERLHEWRKRVKDLWYHARLLEAAWPGVFSALADEAHALSDLLGDDHDLGVLVDRFSEQEWPASIDAEAFVALCHRRRAELQADAFALGARLYAEKPTAFRARLARYLAA